MELPLRVISSVLSVYMLLLFIRILLTWFSGASLGRPQELLKRVTDPYLNIFRRIPFLRTERIDFSPIAAVISLVVVLNIVSTLNVYGRVSLGIVLALIVKALWSAVFFILGFFAILTAVRFISILNGKTAFSPFWQTIDVVVNPTLAFIQRVFFRGTRFTYRTGLAVGVLVLVAAAVLGRVLVNLLVGFLQRLPV